MYKKIVLFALLTLPAFAFAQESQRIAHMNYVEIIIAMPEMVQVNDSIRKEAEGYEAEIRTISEEYQRKLAEYLEQRESMNESIRTRREQEIYTLQERLNNFQEEAQQKMEELQQVLLIPVHEKLRRAIEEVSRENNLLYVLSSEQLLFISPNAFDASPLVRRKLGIQ
jgi:outer membrane protein